MITDKDTQKINRAIDKWFSEHAQAINIFTAEELKEHDKTVADQARKEADEKLAIAVKALEEIKTLGTHSTLSGRTTTGERIDSTTIINTYGIKARDALKEIQG